MPYLGTVELKSSDIRRIDITSSTSATHTLTWTAPNEQSLIVTINGVKQQNNYTVSGTTLTLDTALESTDLLEVIGINDIGTTITPAQGSVDTDQLANDAVTSAKIAAGTIATADIADDAVDADKLANSINTEIAANTAKVTNATNTGDVTGATALTIATGAVDIAMLSATGTASSSTFLRGDNAWAGGGKVLQVVNTVYSTSVTISTTSYATTGLSASITPASTSNKVLIVAFCQCELDSGSGAAGHYALEIHNGTSQLFETKATADNVGTANSKFPASSTVTYLDSPSTTSAITYTMRAKRGGTGIARFQTDSNAGTTADSSIVLMEISA